MAEKLKTSEREGVNRFIARKAQKAVGTWKDAGPLENARGVVHSAFHRLPEKQYRYSDFIDTMLDFDSPVPRPFVEVLARYYGVDEAALLSEQPPCEYEQEIRAAMTAEDERRARLEAEFGDLIRRRESVKVEPYLEGMYGLRELLRKHWYDGEDVTAACLYAFSYGYIKGKQAERARRSRAGVST